MEKILLIDDNTEQLESLKTGVEKALRDKGVHVEVWQPTEADRSPQARFNRLTESRPTLVVTDYDLSTSGLLGLFGSTIVAWCQQKSLPVADYSRMNPSLLPKHPDLFEIRVPDGDEPGEFIAAVFNGFREVRTALGSDATLLNERSVAAVLAQILGEPEAENAFAMYSMRIGPASGALMQTVGDTAPDDISPSSGDKQVVLAFIAGHLLLNSILRFPGPLMSLAALKSYLATDSAGDPAVAALLEPARYKGPFHGFDTFYWLSRVDDVLEPLVPGDIQPETEGELRRVAVEQKLQRTLQRHACPRCDGQNGGFHCVFTKRTVCSRADCSVGSNSWIPQGARVCRIERDFFDEWAPVLGL